MSYSVLHYYFMIYIQTHAAKGYTKFIFIYLYPRPSNWTAVSAKILPTSYAYNAGYLPEINTKIFRVVLQYLTTAGADPSVRNIAIQIYIDL